MSCRIHVCRTLLRLLGATAVACVVCILTSKKHLVFVVYMCDSVQAVFTSIHDFSDYDMVSILRKVIKPYAHLNHLN